MRFVCNHVDVEQIQLKNQWSDIFFFVMYIEIVLTSVPFPKVLSFYQNVEQANQKWMEMYLVKSEPIMHYI